MNAYKPMKHSIITKKNPLKLNSMNASNLNGNGDVTMVLRIVMDDDSKLFML